MRILKALLPTVAAVIAAVSISHADFFYKWSTNANTNANIDTFTWAEGQAPNTVNDSARGMMAALAKFRLDQSGSLATGGTSTAYTLTSNQVFDTLANMSGNRLCFKATVANGAAATLQVDSPLAAKPLQTVSGTALPANTFAAGQIYCATYDNSAGASGAWLVNGLFQGLIASGSKIVLVQSACPTGFTVDVTANDRLPVFAATGGTPAGSPGFSTVFSGSGVVGSHTLTTAEMPSHTHGFGTLATGAGSAHSHGLTGLPIVAASGPGGLNIAAGGGAFGSLNLATLSTDAEAAHTHSVSSGATGSIGGDGTHNHTIPAVASVSAIICTKN